MSGLDANPTRKTQLFYRRSSQTYGEKKADDCEKKDMWFGLNGRFTSAIQEVRS
jgi:hypothetical protein